MTPTDPPPDANVQTLSLEWDLPQPPQKVWRALSDPELLAQWLLPVFGHRLERGASFTFKTQAMGDWDGTVRCRVLEVDAPRRLRTTWCVPGMDTEVTFTLTPTATGTHLSLVQAGFRPDQKREFGGARYGWSAMVGKLSELLGRVA